MGKYSVPENIRKLKPPKTMVKNISGKFYVYEYSCSQHPVFNKDGTKRWKTVTKIGKCIGKITEEDGYVKNQNASDLNEITSKTYGGYEFAYQRSQHVFSLLKQCFGDDYAKKIYTIALIFVVENFVYTNRIKEKYEDSSLSNHFKDLKLGYQAVHNLYKYLGTHGRGIQKFEQTLIDHSSKEIAVDGHVIACSSEQNDLSEYGFKAAKLGSEQINWISAYDVNNNTPLLSYFSPGSMPDKISINTMFQTYSFQNTKFILDRGFNSEKNKKELSKNGNTYVMPMLSNQEGYSSVVAGIHQSKDYFVYKQKSNLHYVYFF